MTASGVEISIFEPDREKTTRMKKICCSGASRLLTRRCLKLSMKALRTARTIESREDEFKNISDEISSLKERISAIRKAAGQDVNAKGRMEFIEKQLAKMKCMITEYYDFAETVVRQMVECVKVFDGGKVEVVFEGGYVVEEQV